MPQSLRFEKYHGLGNDFIVVDGRSNAEAARKAPTFDATQAIDLCDRNFGIGADGVLSVLDPVRPGSAARMLIHNADGSIPEMCGNGIRCVAKYLYDHHYVDAKKFVIDTDAGPLGCEVFTNGDNRVETARIDMGPARFERTAMPMLPAADGKADAFGVTLNAAGRDFVIHMASMGNPHAIIFEALDRAGAEKFGPVIERHEWFPKRTNVEFVELTGPASCNVDVWERGCGITLACGTGACAVAAAGVRAGKFSAGADITIVLPGGPLTITVAPDYSSVWMRGPAVHVFSGTWSGHAAGTRSRR